MTTTTINPQLKSVLNDKVWREVVDNANYDDEFVKNNHVCFKHNELTYDVYFDAYISTTMDWDTLKREIDKMDIVNVECYVADYVHDEDDAFEKEQGEVIDYLDEITLNYY